MKRKAPTCKEAEMAVQNAQAVEKNGITITVYQSMAIKETRLFVRGCRAVLFVRSGGNVSHEVARAFQAIANRKIQPYRGANTYPIKRIVEFLQK